MNQNNNMNVLFYSQHCNTCKNLLLLLKNEQLLGYFKLVCVDNMLDKLPPDMIVPTMIIVNLNKPIAGQETFEWVQQMKFIRQQQIMDVNKKIIQQTQMKNIKKGPIGFDNDIMGGISDKFAFTKVDQPLPHTYFGVNDEDKNVIFTAPEGKKLDKGDHLKNVKDIEERRNTQDNHHASLMKQRQIEAVMVAEHEKLGVPNIQQQQMMQQQQQMMQQQQQQYLMHQQMMMMHQYNMNKK